MRRIVKPNTPQEEIDKHLKYKFNITSYLFDKQLAFVEDPEPFKVAVCSRRAGKTIACAAHLVHTAINNPDTLNLYITLSKANARRLVWRELKKLVQKYQLTDDKKINETNLSITFANGSIIFVSGAHDTSEIENYRGLPIKLCYVDECQSFGAYIEELIDDIIAPALMDHAGSLCLIGTPGPIPTGFFHKCAVESTTWSKHHWTFFDNPHIPVKSGRTHQQLLDRELKRRGVTAVDPSIQREWFGKWILDSDSLLVKYSHPINHYDTLPEARDYAYIMGIDVGFKDADAICVLAWSELAGPTTWLVEEVITPKQGLTELVEQIQVLAKKYPISKMVMDMGGLGLKMGEEMIRRHQIPVEAADKKRKMENIEILNDCLRTGRLRAKGTSRFAQDSYLVEVDRDKSKPDRIVVSDRFHSDIIDAVLYAFKCSPAFSWTPPPDKPVYGSREWAEAQHNAMFEAELEGAQQEAARIKWFNGEES